MSLERGVATPNAERAWLTSLDVAHVLKLNSIRVELGNEAKDFCDR